MVPATAIEVLFDRLVESPVGERKALESELRALVHDHLQSDVELAQLMNALVTQAERYQRTQPDLAQIADGLMHYLLDQIPDQHRHVRIIDQLPPSARTYVVMDILAVRGADSSFAPIDRSGPSTARPPLFFSDNDDSVAELPAGDVPSPAVQPPSMAPNQGPPGKSHAHDGQAQAVVSTGFCEPTAPTGWLPADTPLRCGQGYGFWLQIGAPQTGAIDSRPQALPEVTAGAELDITVTSPVGGPRVSSGVGRVQLQPDGSARVLQQPDQGFPGTDDPIERARLFFRIETPPKPGAYQFWCAIYHRQTLLQSRLVHLDVAREPRPGAGALVTHVDYSLSESLAAAPFDRLGTHAFSITHGQGSGSHTFSFLGLPVTDGSADGLGSAVRHQASLDEPFVAKLLQFARKAMRQVSWGSTEPWTDTARYRYADERRDKQRLAGDLLRLARCGYRIYDALIARFTDGDPTTATRLATLMRRPGQVQIALHRSARATLPIGLLYDYPLDTGNEHGFELCPEFARYFDAGQPLDACRCFAGDCPTALSLRHVCPSGFWGFRHDLALPLTVRKQAAPEIICENDPEITVGVATTLPRWPHHRARLQQLDAWRSVEPATSRDSLFDAFNRDSPHIVYLYCHGGIDDFDTPFLQVGGPHKGRLTRDNLLAKKVRWSATRPLVFANGCHTMAVTPGVAIDLLSAFIDIADASAVIGTEIVIFESLACTFAEAFFAGFMTGEPLARAVRKARLRVLQDGNPLGLVYVPYGLAGLRIVDPVDRPPTPRS